MEINTAAFKEQISELTCIRKSLSDLIKSKAIIESELLGLKDDYDVIQKSRSDEQAVSAKKIKEMEDKVSESAKEKRNLNKTLKRISETIEKLKLKFNKSKLTSTKTEKELNKDLECLQKNLCKKEFCIEELNMNKRKIMNKLYKLQKKIRLNDGHNLQKLENECENLRSQVNLLSTEKEELQELVDICNSEDIITFANGRFTDEMRKTVMDLVAHNVSINKIPEVIITVIGGLTKYNAVKMRTPSTGTRKDNDGRSSHSCTSACC